MNNNINIAELLKDCPKGMELYSPIFGKVYLDKVRPHLAIVVITDKGQGDFKEEFLYDGRYGMNGECMLYPSKSKTTWEGFVPPCKYKDGDFLTYNSTVGTTIFIHRNKKDEHTYKTSFYVALNGRGKLLEYNKYTLVALNGNAETCLATEEEKEKLLQAIKDNGYEWDADTKTLKKVVVPHTTKKFYIRIGEIPSDEKSAVHRGDAVVSYEDGVSVYDCVGADGLYRIVMPLPLKEGQGMTYECMIQEITQCRYEIEKPRSVYLVSGTEVGKGHDNEPLIKDVKILEDLTAQFNTKSDNTEKNIVKTEFRDGDIVFSGVSLISILKEIKPSKNLHCYVSTDTSGKLYIDEGGWTSQNMRHATEEEKQKLFKAIKDKGYRWNAETKTLEKEEKKDKFDIATLKPFDKVLVRYSNDDPWIAAHFSHYTKGAEDNYPYFASGSCFEKCVPYEGNEHLLGTTNDCDEYYKTWNDETDE
jgi:hypothetical protein